MTVNAVLKNPVNGRYSLCIRFSQGQQRAFLNTGIRLKKSQFKKGKVTNHDNFPEINQKITELTERAEYLYFSLGLSPKDLKRKLSGVSGVMLSDYVKGYLERLTTKYSTKSNYAYQLSMVLSFKDVELSKIDLEYLTGLKTFLSKKGLEPSTVKAYMESLRNVLTEAVETEVIKENIFKVKTRRIGKLMHVPKKSQKYLSEEQLKLLSQTRFLKPHMENARLTWLLQFYMGGLDISMALQMRQEDISGTHYTIPRGKTGVQTAILITPQARQIINKFDSSPFVLPYLKKHKMKTEEQRYKHIASAAATIHYSLQQIGKHLGLKLSSHMAKKTYGHILNIYGVSLALGQHMLKHSTLSQQDTYRQGLNQHELDAKYNEIAGVAELVV